MDVRKALDSDRQTITEIVIAAFGEVEGQEIANLVTDLLEDPSAQPLLSLVAVTDDKIVGHILFTKVRIKHSQQRVCASILAPLSVHPKYQNRGIGRQLIKQGLKQLKATGVELVFVLGHPGYYPKHGFCVARTKGFDAPYPIPPENSAAWMVQELQSGVMGHVSGQVMCADALNDPRHWRE